MKDLGVKTQKMFSAISSTGIAVSSGLVAYGVYQHGVFGQKSVAELQQQQQKMFMEELSRVQYINLSTPYGSPATRGTTASPRFASQLDKEFSRSRTSRRLRKLRCYLEPVIFTLA